MRRSLGVALAFLACTWFVAGQSDDEQKQKDIMKASKKSMDKIKKSVAAKSLQEVAQDAAGVEDAYKQVEQFWAKMNKPDAVKWSKETQAGVKDLLAAAASGNQEKAVAALDAASASCTACHKVYREKLPDGSYKMKL